MKPPVSIRFEKDGKFEPDNLLISLYQKDCYNLSKYGQYFTFSATIKMADKIGRPTKYNNNFPQRVEEYIQEKISMDKLPTIEELSYRLGVNDDSVNEYSKRYPKFETCINRLKQVQSHMLQEKALLGEWRNTMAIFILKNNHKWTDKADLKLKGLTVDDLLSLLESEKDVI